MKSKLPARMPGGFAVLSAMAAGAALYFVSGAGRHGADADGPECGAGCGSL